MRGDHMATILNSTKDQSSEMKDAIARYTNSQREPIYVQSVVEEFGKTLAQQDEVRSMVWEMISHGRLVLRNDLTLTAAQNGAK